MNIRLDFFFFFRKEQVVQKGRDMRTDRDACSDLLACQGTSEMHCVLPPESQSWGPMASGTLRGTRQTLVSLLGCVLQSTGNSPVPSGRARAVVPVETERWRQPREVG